MVRKLRWLGLMIVFVIASTSLAGCGAKSAGQNENAHEVVLAEISSMPSQVQSAPQLVRDSYRFAATHADALHQIPCYCGCGAMEHRSNYACFWQKSGQVDEHALNCGICVDIAQDVQRGLERGQSLADIRTQVDADYSRFGPPTDTAPVAVSAQ
ncbi:MAG: hypothetical protein IT328_23585 [Caldilineaceae bacterium]|nr:hypothetical protein [Caldilineaceae bacterium]